MKMKIQTKRRGNLLSARKSIVEQTRLRQGFERKLYKQMVGYFSSTGRQASREIQSGRLQLKDIEQRLSQILLPHYRSVIESFANRFMFTKQENQWERIIRNYIATQGGDKITRISGTTRRRINKIISDGQVEGLGVDRIARNIRTQMSEPFTRYRSALIARTETHNASSYTNQAVAESYEVPMKKRWVSTNDDRTRSHHSAMNGVEVDLEADFEVPYKGVTYKMKHAGDPRGGPANVINCRCVILYVEPDDFVIDEDTPQEQPLPNTSTREPEIPIPIIPVLDISSVVVKPTNVDYLTREQFKRLYNIRLNKMTSDKQKLVIDKYEKPTLVTREGSDGYYDKFRGKLVADTADDEILGGEVKQTRNILVHEFGHHIDYIGEKTKTGVSRYWSTRSEKFQKAFLEDKKLLGLDTRGKVLREKLLALKDKLFTVVDYKRTLPSGKVHTTKQIKYNIDGADALSDIIDALLRGRLFTEYNYVYGHGRYYYTQRPKVEFAEAFANIFDLLGRNDKGIEEARKLFPNMVKAVEERLDELLED